MKKKFVAICLILSTACSLLGCSSNRNIEVITGYTLDGEFHPVYSGTID